MTAAATRPTWLDVLPHQIPERLRAMPRWVVWRAEFVHNRWTKVPYQADAPTVNAATNDPSTWASFDAAVAGYFGDETLNGLGYVLDGDDPVTGVDLDHCRDGETGAIAPWAQAIVDRLQTYTEVSPSGTGLRLFSLGTLPGGGRVRGKVGPRQDGKIELYDDGRYLTVTGHHLAGTPPDLESRATVLATWHVELFPLPAPPASTPRPPAAPTVDDAALLDQARRAANGDKFRALYDRGDRAGYGSASEADLALCVILAFWTQRDAPRTDRLFRGSALMRDKWDERRGTQTYGARTLAGAIKKCRETYEPRHGRASEPEAGSSAHNPSRDDARSAESTRPSRDGSPTSPWPTPRPITPARPPVAPFDIATLMPEPFAPWVHDVAERVQCPPDYVAITVMVSAGSVIGRQCAVRPKRFDDWEVVPNLWGLLIGPPGIMKSPAIKEGLRPLRRLIAAEMERYQEATRDARFIRMKREAREKRLKKLLEEALEAAQGDEHAPGVLEIRHELRKPSEPLPTERVYRTNDATVEKVAVLLQANPNGFLVDRDEIGGLLKTMDREGHQNDRAFFEECWNGSGSYRVDRIERGTLYIPAACLSLFGGIQPAPLDAYLREWERRGLDDGFSQRFQLMVYPDVTPYRRVDRWPETLARETAIQAFRGLDRLDPARLHALTRETDALAHLNFDDDAQAAFDPWYDAWQIQLRSERWPPVLRQHFAKYPSLVPALALIDHLVAGGTGPIPERCVTRALAWVPYLTSHAERVYAPLTDRAQGATAALAQRLCPTADPIPDPFSLRWVYRHGWTTLTERADVERAVARLIDHGWLREVVVSTTGTGGRPTLAFAINPAVRAPGFVGFVSDSNEGADGSSMGSVSFGTESRGQFPEKTYMNEWNSELLAPCARGNPPTENLETVPATYCQNCHNPISACVCAGPEFLDDARE